MPIHIDACAELETRSSETKHHDRACGRLCNAFAAESAESAADDYDVMLGS